MQRQLAQTLRNVQNGPKVQGNQRMSSADPVKAAARTLDLFEAFANAGGPLSLSEIAQAIGVPVSSCHSLIRTLQARGYVYVLEKRKRIYPTRRLADIARKIALYDTALERLTPFLAEIVDKTGESVILGKMQGDHVVYLDVLPGTHTVRYTASPGDTFPTHASAIGKSALSLLDDDDLDAAISRLKLTQFTDATITDAAAFKADILRGKRRGYFLSEGETVADVMGISTPHIVAGEPYAVGIAGPTSRLRDEFERYLKVLIATGRRIARIEL